MHSMPSDGHTKCLRQVCATRAEAVQAMWELFVDLGWWGRNDAVTFWEFLFDRHQGIYDPSVVYSASDRFPPLIRLVRRLMPHDWYKALKKGEDRDLLTAEYKKYLSTIQVSELELKWVLEHLSESSRSRNIFITYEIVEIEQSPMHS